MVYQNDSKFDLISISKINFKIAFSENQFYFRRSPLGDCK